MRRTSKSVSLFLMEMILVIFFFAVCAVICARLFVQSHRTRTQSETLTGAVLCAQNVAELVYATDGSAAKIVSVLEARYGEGCAKEDGTTALLAFLDGYVLEYRAEREADFLTGTVTVYANDQQEKVDAQRDVIYELPVKIYCTEDAA